MRLVGLNATTAANGSDQVGSDQVSKLSKQTATSITQNSTQGAIADDTTTLTSNGSTVQSLTQSALQADPSRSARVDSLKQAVSSGQYQLDPDQIAESLVNAAV